MLQQRAEEAQRLDVPGRMAGSAPAATPALAPFAPHQALPRGNPADRERYHPIKGNPVQRVAEAPVSTFSIAVDTGSYANVRRFLNQGRLPPADAVRVEDAGPGPSDPERIFERFHRGDEARGEGSGLGLAIVRAIADRHGGRVEVDGARFTLVVPPNHPLVRGGDPFEQMAGPRFDIQGKPPDGAEPGSTRAMLRTLLTDRFKLRVHREKRELPVYALTVAREGRFGPAFRASSVDCVVYETERRKNRELQPPQERAILVGAPIGVLVGVRLWSAIAAELGVPDQPVVNTVALALIIPGAVALAVAVALVPIWLARRTRVAAELRTE